MKVLWLALQLVNIMWKTYTRLSTYVQDTSNKVLIEDLLGQKKYKASPRQVAESIIRKEKSQYTADFSKIGITGYSYTENDKIEIQNSKHWLDRNWISSLFYYISSRNIQFCDDNENANHVRAELIKNYFQNDGASIFYKAQGTSKTLPPPNDIYLDPLKISTELLNRKTERSYQRVFLPLEDLSSLLYKALQEARETLEVYTNGSKDKPLNLFCSRGVAFEYFLIIYKVTNLPSGVYHYNILKHELTLIEAGDFRELMIDCLQGMSSPKTANLTVVLTSDFEIYKWRYRHERSLRNLYIESGRYIQRILQTSMMLGLGGLVTPAIKDSKLLSLLKLDKLRFSPMYTLTLGFRNGYRASKENA